MTKREGGFENMKITFPIKRSINKARENKEIENYYCQTGKKIENKSLHRPALFEHC